jgi:hypothetical protein
VVVSPAAADFTERTRDRIAKVDPNLANGGGMFDHDYSAE